MTMATPAVKILRILFLVVQDNLATGHINLDDGILVDGSRKYGLGKLVDKLTLHQPLDRTGAVCRIVTASDHVILESLRELNGDTLLGEPVLKLLIWM